MITFSNDSEIDIRAIKTFGLSAKETTGAIGRFGTGLKYAIAVVLRNGGSIKIHSGENTYTAFTKDDDFRGQEKSFVFLDGPDGVTELGFTTELGRDWEPWQAFREFYSNTLDENGGCAFSETDGSTPEVGKTSIVIDLSNFDAIFFSLEEYFIAPTETPLWSCNGFEVYKGRSKHVFYQGIRVHELKKPAAFRYNLTSYLELTEDRTAKYPFMVDHDIAGHLAKCEDADVCIQALGRSGEYEHTLDFVEDVKGIPSAAFSGAVVSLGCDAPISASHLVAMSLPESHNEYSVAAPNQKGSKELREAVELATSLGLDKSGIRFVLGVGLDVPGDFAVREKNIILSEAILTDQLKMSASVVNGICRIKDQAKPFRYLVSRVLETRGVGIE